MQHGEIKQSPIFLKKNLFQTTNEKNPFKMNNHQARKIKTIVI